MRSLRARRNERGQPSGVCLCQYAQLWSWSTLLWKTLVRAEGAEGRFCAAKRRQRRDGVQLTLAYTRRLCRGRVCVVGCKRDALTQLWSR